MTFDERFDKEGYDEQHRFVFGLAWNAGMNAAGETGLDVDAPIRKEAERYRVIRQDHEGKVLPDLALYAGRALDQYIDAAIDRMRGIGAA